MHCNASVGVVNQGTNTEASYGQRVGGKSNLDAFFLSVHTQSATCAALYSISTPNVRAIQFETLSEDGKKTTKAVLVESDRYWFWQ